MNATKRAMGLVACLLIVVAHIAQSASAVERAVLLKNGNVLAGDTRQLADEVVVETTSSTIRLAADDVELVANTMSDIYAYKSRRTSVRPAARADLIRWCLLHNLLNEAKQELIELHRSSPDHAGLAVLHQNLQRRVQQPSPSALQKTVLPGASPLHPDLQFAMDRRDQLSKSSMRDFVRTIQPLLLNRCALAGCHGKAPQSSYQLMSGRSFTPQGLTHRNLGATLQRAGSPAEHSLLWQSASSEHGGKQRILQDDEQAKLYHWLRRVAVELTDGADGTGRSASKVATEVFAADGSDPFDPSEFNSQHAAR